MNLFNILLVKNRYDSLPEVLDGQRSSEVPQDLQQDPGPVTPVAQLPQVRQRLLWRTHCTLQLRQLITCTHSSNNSVLRQEIGFCESFHILE